MKYSIRIAILLFTITISTAATWPTRLEQKINATISKTFQVPDFSLKEVTVDTDSESATSKAINNHLFAIEAENSLQGYIYVGEAPSMKNVFDYAVLFSSEMEIINTKVLIYREKHGRQIGMKRWLKQFFGMTPADEPQLGLNVDGITGATISATSMTDAVREVLASMQYLQQHKKLTYDH